MAANEQVDFSGLYWFAPDGTIVKVGRCEHGPGDLEWQVFDLAGVKVGSFCANLGNIRDSGDRRAVDFDFFKRDGSKSSGEATVYIDLTALERGVDKINDIFFNRWNSSGGIETVVTNFGPIPWTKKGCVTIGSFNQSYGQYIGIAIVQENSTECLGLAMLLGFFN